MVDVGLRCVRTRLDRCSHEPRHVARGLGVDAMHDVMLPMLRGRPAAATDESDLRAFAFTFEIQQMVCDEAVAAACPPR